MSALQLNSKSQTEKDFACNKNISFLQKLKPQDRFKVLGEVVALMLRSKIHSHFGLQDIQHMLIPPIDHNQFRIYHKKDYPVGFVTWAKLTKETEEKFLSGKQLLKYEDWNAGEQIVLVDFIAPFGHAKQIAHDLKHNIFPNDVGKALRFDEIGKLKAVYKLHGVNVR